MTVVLSSVARSASFRGSRLSLAVIVSIGFLLPSDARSQEEQSQQLEEIVVTAQKRAERLQDIPLSITAVSGDQLEELGAEGFHTLANRVPGLQLIEINPTQTQLAMRGVVTSQITNDKGQVRDTVGLYFDEAPINVAIANPNFQLVDLERVEVLRGPQGTLYGAGSVSGAIRYVTRQPQLDAAAMNASVTGAAVDTAGGNVAATAVANLPIVSGVSAVRAVGYYRDYSGFLDNRGIGRDDSNDVRIVGGRLSGLWQISDAFSATLQGVAQTTEIDDSFAYFEELGPRLRSTPIPESREDDQYLYSLVLQYDMGGARLTSASSYRESETLSIAEASAIPVFFLGAPPGLFTTSLPVLSLAESFSQEVRIASANEARLQWIGGAFYSQEDLANDLSMDVPDIEQILGLLPGPVFGVPTDRIYELNLGFETKQTALFGEATYDLTDRLALLVGVRYYDYDQEALIESRGLLNGGITQIPFEAKNDGFSTKYNVSYELGENKLVYAQAASGFRIGGVGLPLDEVLCGDDLAALGLTEAPESYDPDELWNYEVGSKTEWAGRRVGLNAAAYYIDWRDIQSFARLGCGANLFFNASQASIRGAELETTIRLSQALTLSGSLTYTDTELGDLTPEQAQVLQASAGDRLPFVPEISGYLALDYAFPINGGWSLLGGVDVSYVGERHTALESSPNALPLDAYALGNLRIGAQREHWQILLSIDNLWNERAEFSKEPYVFHMESLLQGGAVTRVAAARPRTIGLTLKWTY